MSTWYDESKIKQPGSTVLAKWNAERNRQREEQASALQRRQAATHVRQFQAAITNRLTSSWSVTNTSLDADLHRSLSALRARSRNFRKNNPFGRKFVRMVSKNVVGPSGFTLQSQPADPGKPIDRADAAALEAYVARWSKRGMCDVTGQLSFVDVCKLFIETVAVDGEVLIRKVRGRAINEFGYALQFLDVDRLDTNMNGELRNGNFVRMGVELNSYGRPVAYHIKTRHPGEALPGGSAGAVVERVPASDIIHRFIAEGGEQRRGIPWMHAGMTKLNMLDGYEEAAIVAARTGAAKMGFFVQKDAAPPALGEDETEDGDFVTDAEPGAFGVLPSGYEFQQWNPDYPQANYAAFVKANMREIATAFDVAYNTLANDLEGVNFSSIRSGTLEERDGWMVIQNWMTEAFLTEVYEDVVSLGLLANRIVGAGGPLPATKLQKFQMHSWQPRRWSWVDPLKDIQAIRLAIQTGLLSPQIAAAQMGVDVEDVIEAIAQFEALVAAAKVTTIDLSGQPIAPDSPPDPAEQP